MAAHRPQTPPGKAAPNSQQRRERRLERLGHRAGARSSFLLAFGVLCAAFALTIGSAVNAVVSTSHSQATPQATVRDFLAAAEVDGDGVTANRYLTAHARASFHAAVTAPSAQMFFTGDHLVLGGLPVDTNASLRQLSYRVVPDDADRRVEISHGGQSFWFTLRPATRGELARVMAPPTPWRIDSSVRALGSLPGAVRPASGV
jgi:hypothetical protein